MLSSFPSGTPLWTTCMMVSLPLGSRIMVKRESGSSAVQSTARQLCTMILSFTVCTLFPVIYPPCELNGEPSFDEIVTGAPEIIACFFGFMYRSKRSFGLVFLNLIFCLICFAIKRVLVHNKVSNSRKPHIYEEVRPMAV